MAVQTTHTPDDFVTVANVQVDSVTPHPSGFLVMASGEDYAEYRLDMHVGLPLDSRTQAVVGEILSQSEWRLSRRTRQPLKPKLRNRSKDGKTV